MKNKRDSTKEESYIITLEAKKQLTKNWNKKSEEEQLKEMKELSQELLHN